MVVDSDRSRPDRRDDSGLRSGPVIRPATISSTSAMTRSAAVAMSGLKFRAVLSNEVAELVAGVGTDQGDISTARLSEDVALAADDALLAARGERRTQTGFRVEPADPGAAGPDGLGEGALGTSSTSRSPSWWARRRRDCW